MVVRVFRKRKILLKLLIIAVIFIIAAVSLMSYFKGNILPVISTMSEATVRALAVNAINNASHTVIDESIDYSELVKIDKDENGNINLIQANTVRINRLARDLANMSEKNIEEIKEQTIELPIGAFTGSAVLSGVGPVVNVSLLPIGNVTCDFVSSFDDVGINQTKHSIYIYINTTISIVLPVSSVPVSVSTSILVVENIIVGKVPDVYLNMSSNSTPINLVP
ncbi:MAG: sporulation protein YunB [Clostridia bacterium]|nr:sporulation protein YunB [Clostridia bacterium]MCX4366640.1 sporulation protein YunB [Clostridia bacterium]